jgi:hypothetical protein
MSAPASTAAAQHLASEADQNPGEFGVVVGVGSMNCRQWLSSSEAKEKGDNWLLGWWTATVTNDKNRSSTVTKMTEKEILTETKELCKMAPETVLTNAIAQIYFKFERGKQRRGK